MLITLNLKFHHHLVMFSEIKKAPVGACSGVLNRFTIVRVEDYSSVGFMCRRSYGVIW